MDDVSGAVFLPAPGVSGTVRDPSVDVDDGSAGRQKQALPALSLCVSDIADHTSMVSRQYKVSMSDDSTICLTGLPDYQLPQLVNQIRDVA